MTHPQAPITPPAALPPALPSGYRATTCPRCGGAFACGVGADRSAPCFCVAIALDARQLAELRARYSDCLCAACLTALANPSEAAR